MKQMTANLLISISLALSAMQVCADDTPAPAPDPNAVRTAAAEADQAEWAARKARLDYYQAAAPGSGLTNAVEAGDNTGKLEAAVLMSRALSSIAATVAKDVKSEANTGKVLVFTGAESVDTSLWDLFQYRTKALESRIDALELRAEALDKRYVALTPPPTREAVEQSATASVEERSAAFGLSMGLEAWSTAFSYIASDYKAGPIEVAKSDELRISAIVTGHFG